MEEEVQVIEKNQTWELVDRPKDKDVVGVKWIYKVKHNPDGSVQRNKARLVAKGYSQQPEIDFNETFAPVSRLDSIRALIAFASGMGWKLFQLDVKSAFLNGEIKEEVYVDQPQGFVIKGKEHMVYKLKKALYGLKQAPRAWYSEINSFLIKSGFKRSMNEPTLFVKHQGTDILIVMLYVDDIIFAGSCENMVEAFKNDMTKKYEMSDMGLLRHFLGMEIYQDKENIFICQRNYAEKILRTFGMFECNPAPTPLVMGEKLYKKDGGNFMDSTYYRSLIGKLLYLCTTRPDLMFAASLLSRFMQNPSHIHLGAAKHVLRYIQGTLDYGLCYEKNKEVKLIGYSDSDLGGCGNDLKSTSGYCFSLGSGIFSWQSKKQDTVVQSTAEAEYVSAAVATSQVIWLRRIFTDFVCEQQDGTPIYCDNKSAIDMAKNPVNNNRTRHIALKHHFIRDAVEDGEIKLVFCPSEDQVADIFTKALPKQRFQQLREALGIRQYVKGENVGN